MWSQVTGLSISHWVTRQDQRPRRGSDTASPILRAPAIMSLIILIHIATLCVNLNQSPSLPSRYLFRCVVRWNLWGAKWQKSALHTPRS